MKDVLSLHFVIFLNLHTQSPPSNQHFNLGSVLLLIHVLQWWYGLGIIFVLRPNITILPQYHRPFVQTLACYATHSLAFKALDITILSGGRLSFTLITMETRLLFKLGFGLGRDWLFLPSHKIRPS